MTPADARTDFLRRLPADDFAPSGERVAEAARATGADLPRGSAVDPEAGRAVDVFAAEFWSLPPDARRARWEALGAETLPPAVAARLRGLAVGLDVSADPHPDSTVETVASALRAGFILPPRARAVARAGWLADATSEVRAAADRLRQDRPDLAALDPLLSDPPAPALPPEWVPELLADAATTGRFPDGSPRIGWENDPANIVYSTARPPRLPPHIDWGDDRDDGSWHPDGNRSSNRKAENATPAEGFGGAWGMWGTIAVVAILIRVFVAMVPKSDTTPGRYYSPPPATPPPARWDNTPGPKFTLTEDEIRAIALYDPASGKPPPPKYGLLKLVGMKDEEWRKMRELAREVKDAEDRVRELEEQLKRAKTK